MKCKYGGRFGDCLIYWKGECKILLSGPLEREEHGWHFSISHPSRYPTWEEMRNARYELIPDSLYMVMVLPPKGEYVNIHPNCFHWHELGPKLFNGGIIGIPKP